MPKFTNIFHTFCTKLSIKYFERHLVLKYHGGMHRYIQDQMDFLDISFLGATYRYFVKIEQNLKKRHDNLGLGTPHRKSQEREAQT
jgi:hypothetical protein